MIIRTLETTPRGATHWSTRGMAKAVDLSHTAISRIWHTFGLQAHRSETFKLSNDPLVGREGPRIVGLYVANHSYRTLDSRTSVRSYGKRCDLHRASQHHDQRHRHNTDGTIAHVDCCRGSTLIVGHDHSQQHHVERIGA